MEKILTWVKENKMIAIAGGAILLLFLLPKLLRKTYRRKRRAKIIASPVRRRKYNKAAPGKKPWQIKGSLAAKRRMAQIRRQK